MRLEKQNHRTKEGYQDNRSINQKENKERDPTPGLIMAGVRTPASTGDTIIKKCKINGPKHVHASLDVPPIVGVGSDSR